MPSYTNNPRYHPPTIRNEDLMKDLSSQGIQISPTHIFAKQQPLQKVRLSDVRAIASYNWLDETAPTIVVPGSPNIWTEKHMPFSVAKDSGIHYIYQNAHRIPSSPHAPLIAAVEHCQPSFEWGDIDLLTDRNSLRKLLRWIEAVDGMPDRDFRIDVHLVGERNVIFNRWEPQTSEYGGYGYGFSFQEATTKPVRGCVAGSGHHRVIQYNLEGLKILLRFGVDACLRTSSNTPDTFKSEEADKDSATAKPGAGLEMLIPSLGGLSLSPSASSTKVDCKDRDPPSPLVKLVEGGRLVPQNCLVEITTRSTKSFENFDWSGPYPQLFLSQTPHLYVGIHNFGRFHDIHKYQLGVGVMRSVEANSQRNIAKLTVLLAFVMEKARSGGKAKSFALVCKGRQLNIHQHIEGHCVLPEDLKRRFESPNKEGQSSDVQKEEGGE